MEQHNCNEASWLISPATRPGFLDRARAVDADVAIFDFEDSLPKELKLAGRLAYREAMMPARDGGPKVAVRINALSTYLGIQDLMFLIDREVVPDLLILPRSGPARDAAIVADLLRSVRPDTRIIAIVETLQGVRSLRDPVSLGHAVGGLHFGAADLAADIGRRPSRVDLDCYRHEVVMAARALGIASADSPCFRLDDPVALRNECERAHRQGFDGKVAIHPDQVSVINEYFRHTTDDINFANAVIRRHSSDVIAVVDGEMTGPPLVRYAEKVLRHELTALDLRRSWSNE